MDVDDGLVSFDGTGQVFAGAAERWDIRADGLTWTNGHRLVAQNFLASTLRRMNPDAASEKGCYIDLRWALSLAVDSAVLKDKIVRYHCGQSGGDFAVPETHLAYMRPSAKPGYNWVKPDNESAMDLAGKIADPVARDARLPRAKKTLLDDYIFAPFSIVLVRHLVKPGGGGWAGFAARYNNSQFQAWH